MIISKTPLRISFAGGGTDIDSYYKTGYGAVVSAAINKHVYVTVHRRFDNSLRVGYTKTEIVNHADELEHDIVKACLEMVGIDNGVEITSIGEVPAGTGMGSSGALTVGLLNALYSHVGKRLSSYELMEKACQIEIDILKQPIGKQDQAAAAFGGLNYFKFRADGSVGQERIELSQEDFKKLESRLLVFYTGQTHSAGAILREQKSSTGSHLKTMDEMRDQADQLKEKLMKDGFGAYFGGMLQQAWERKKLLSSGISNLEINRMYDSGIQAGALGGKLLGAGGGGFLLFYCEEDKQEQLRKALGLQQLYFRVARYGSRVVYFE
ncbi:MAG: GHMP kinase [Blautia sp.]|nr:GHMP kinase [Blautia sp.]